MLRKLTIQNFVHFQEEQIFIFQEGSYFFIGGNRSGKSCTFKAIRRCMSTSKNFFMSTRHNKAEPSYVICEYASNSDTDKHCTTIYSCVVSVPNENTINVKTISVEERNTVDDVFNVLTENSRLRFENIDDVLQVIDNGNIVTLAKAPEGLLEAQICAILFSVKQFKTICLEEPGKGMHTQMIERLRDLALKKRQNKTILMITHVPAFLNTWKIEKIFFFRRSDQEGRPLFRAKHGNDLLPGYDHRSRILSSDYSLLSIFFARRVLLVEGRSDERFISAVKSILLDDRDLAIAVLQSARPDLEVDALYRFLSSLQVLPLNGHRNKLRFEKICTALGLERYFMLDYDAILDNQRETSRFFRDFGLEYLENEYRLNGVNVLEGEGIFVWTNPPPGAEIPNQRGGTIEDALIQLINNVGAELRGLFMNNNVVLNWDYRERNDGKLFEDRNLTDDNVVEVVLAVIRSCLNHMDSDVFRLLRFLVRGPAP